MNITHPKSPTGQDFLENRGISRYIRASLDFDFEQYFAKT
jgi:hypothetical protein